jgi:hypothetical protein
MIQMILLSFSLVASRFYSEVIELREIIDRDLYPYGLCNPLCTCAPFRLLEPLTIFQITQTSGILCNPRNTRALPVAYLAGSFLLPLHFLVIKSVEVFFILECYTMKLYIFLQSTILVSRSHSRAPHLTPHPFLLHRDPGFRPSGETLKSSSQHVNWGKPRAINRLPVQPFWFFLPLIISISIQDICTCGRAQF